MDREKLCKAAEEQANRSTHWPWGDRKDCFISGAYWLMEQPLTERLTEAEKEKIIKRYNDELEMAQYHTKKMKEKCPSYEQTNSRQCAQGLYFTIEVA